MTASGWRVLVCNSGYILIGNIRACASGGDFVIVDHYLVLLRWWAIDNSTGPRIDIGRLVREGPLPGTGIFSEGDGVEVRIADIKRTIPANGEV